MGDALGGRGVRFSHGHPRSGVEQDGYPTSRSHPRQGLLYLAYEIIREGLGLGCGLGLGFVSEWVSGVSEWSE